MCGCARDKLFGLTPKRAPFSGGFWAARRELGRARGGLPRRPGDVCDRFTSQTVHRHAIIHQGPSIHTTRPLCSHLCSQRLSRRTDHALHARMQAGHGQYRPTCGRRTRQGVRPHSHAPRRRARARSLVGISAPSAPRRRGASRPWPRSRRMKVAVTTTAHSWCPQRPGSMVPGSQRAAPLCTTSGSIVSRRRSTPARADGAQRIH